MKRKHISLKTDKASLLLQLGDIPYDDAKHMTEDQVISLYHRDHNILHETGHPDRDKFWNLTHRLIAAHRTKTKQDAKIIAKSKRIRRREEDRLLTQIASFSLDNWDHRVVQRYLGMVERRKLRSPNRWPPKGSRSLKSRPWQYKKT